MQRSKLIREANKVGHLSRYPGAPVLYLNSSVETLAAWLQWCDPDGCHTVPLRACEDFDPYTLEEAWEALGRMLEGA